MNTNPIPKPNPPRRTSNPVLWVVLLISLSIIGVVGFILYSVGHCVSDLSHCLKYGMYSGSPRKPAAPHFNPQKTEYGIRWFPNHVHFGPDGDTLLVSLCHVKRSALCRIGKYSIAKNQWLILPFEENRTYYNPVFSPDGQWIVATRISVDQNINLTREEFRLIKMRPDGSGVESIGSPSGIQGLGATFAHNGKKLIYWGQFAGAFDFGMLDWQTGEETRLTKLYHRGSDGNRPFLTPDGEKFVFTSRFSCIRNGEVKHISSIMAAKVADAPLSCENVLEKVEVLWPNELRTETPLDMDRQGRVLYRHNLEMKKKAGNPAALAIRQYFGHKEYLELSEEAKKKPVVRLTDEQYRHGEGVRRFFIKYLLSDQFQQGSGPALFLRKPNVDTQDEAAFDLYFGGAASVSPDSQWLIFVGGDGPAASIGLLKLGDPMRNVRFLDWPKLDLVPFSTQAQVKP